MPVLMRAHRPSKFFFFCSQSKVLAPCRRTKSSVRLMANASQTSNVCSRCNHSFTFFFFFFCIAQHQNNWNYFASLTSGQCPHVVFRFIFLMMCPLLTVVKCFLCKSESGHQVDAFWLIESHVIHWFAEDSSRSTSAFLFCLR